MLTEKNQNKHSTLNSSFDALWKWHEPDIILELIVDDLLISGGQEDYMKSIVGPNITMGPKSAELTSQNVTVTRVKATLGREAIIKCRAENLVGQKTVSELYLKFR